MNKLLLVAVFVALLALSAESFRVPRQAEENNNWILQSLADTFKYYYDNTVNTASGYVESVKNMKLNEKAKKLYSDTSAALSTYTGIAHDQIYHIFYPTQ